MAYFSEKLEKLLSSAGLTPYKLALQINEDPALIHKIVKGQRPASDRILKKLEGVKDLNVNYRQLRAWQILTKIDPDEFKYLYQELEFLIENQTEEALKLVEQEQAKRKNK